MNHVLCVAGTGSEPSVWFVVNGEYVQSIRVEYGNRNVVYAMPRYLSERLLLVPVESSRGPRKTSVCRYLTHDAASKLVKLFQANGVTPGQYVAEVIRALNCQYSWQIANGAVPLRDRGAQAKVYAKNFSVHIFETREERQAAVEELKPGSRHQAANTTSIQRMPAFSPR